MQAFTPAELEGYYVLNVQYVRYHAEDGDILESDFPGIPFKEAAAMQLSKELQDAADERGVAGTFFVHPAIVCGEPDHAKAVSEVFRGAGCIPEIETLKAVR